jgi:hypothetical protein
MSNRKMQNFTNVYLSMSEISCSITGELFVIFSIVTAFALSLHSELNIFISLGEIQIYFSLGNHGISQVSM